MNNIKEVECPGYNDNLDVVGDDIEKEKKSKIFSTLLRCKFERIINLRREIISLGLLVLTCVLIAQLSSVFSEGHAKS